MGTERKPHGYSGPFCSFIFNPKDRTLDEIRKGGFAKVWTAQDALCVAREFIAPAWKQADYATLRAEFTDRLVVLNMLYDIESHLEEAEEEERSHDTVPVAV